MYRHTRTCALAMTMAAALVLAAPSSVRAQVAGENVNMVTGTGWPGGDPFLQRQNEPSIAVSSANPQHLLAGANDYRTVDIPNPNAGPKMAGDAWLGVFKSLDGGQTWKSYLLPGFPQESLINPGAQGAVCGVVPATRTTAAVNVPCTSGADPVVRAGPDGMFYFGGIMFNRNTIPATAKGNFGKVFLTRFIDLNDKENGDVSAGPVLGVDPIRYVDVKEVALGGPNDFVDKPWIAVDVPRNATQTCTVVTPAGTAKTFFAHTVYVAYLRILSGTQSDVMVRHSDDCGKTWAAPVKVSDATSLANEGPSLAIDPVKGHVYVTWRRVGGLNAGQTDSIMLSRSFSRGARFTKPRLVAGVTPFDQPTTPSTTVPTSATFRVTLFPTSAISVDSAGVRRLHVAWSERAGGSTTGYARVMVATKRISPPPVTEYEPDENDSTCQKLDAPRAADNRPVAADGLALTFSGNAGVQFAAGHQFMPSLTFSQGKLMLVYYDSRLDHTRAYYTPHTVDCQDVAGGLCQVPATGETCPSDGSLKCFTLNADGSFYDVVRGPWGAPVVSTVDKLNGLESLTDPFTQIFSAYVDEGTVANVRHSVEVRVASAVPADAVDFTSAPLSKFPFGTRGDEGFLAPRNGGSVHLPGFLGDEAIYDPTAISLVETDPTTHKLTLQKLQQLKLNPPNLPLFRGGSTPFLGDYIDIQGPAFVKKNGKWAFNTDPTTSPVFHAVWTTNEDVRPPPDAKWDAYKPIFVPATSTGSTTSLWDQSSPRVNCDPLNASDYLYASSRNQNIYTARVTEGLVVSSPQNSKPLDKTIVRSFVIAATNTTGKPMTATFSFAFTAPLPQTASAGFATTSTGQPDTTVGTATAVIAPHSTVSRSLFVIASVLTAPLTVTVTETGGGSGFVLLNPPGLVPGTVAPPDNCTGTCTGIAAGEQFASVQIAANLSNANLSNANLSNANLSNANLSNANLSNANLSNANLSNANLSNAALANLSNANLSNANLSNANLSNANLSNANLSNANLSNANLSNASVSDLNYEVQNTGNTSTSYAIKVVGTTDPLHPLPPVQLILAKTYTTPTAVGCAIKEEPHSHILASINDVSGAIVPPGSSVDPGANDSSVTNATLTLAPGEKAQITLRARVSLGRMAAIGQQIAPQAVPQAVPPNTTTYATLVNRTWTWTALAYDPTSTTFTATVAKDSFGPIAAGSVTFVANGTIYMGTVPVTVPTGGSAGTASIHVTGLPPGATVIAYYSGTNLYLPSNDSFTVVASHWTPLAPVPTTVYTVPDRGVAALNGKVFLFGGLADGYVSDVLQYDTAAESWVNLGSLTQPVLSNGTTYLSSRHFPIRAVNLGGRVFSVAAWYEPVSNPDVTTPEYLVIEEWGATGSLGIVGLIPNSGVRWIEAVVGLGGRLYILGSYGAYESAGSGFATVTWDISTQSTTVESGGMTSGVAGYSAVAANGTIYLIGGAIPSYCTYNYASLPAACIPHQFPPSQVWWTYTPGFGTAPGSWVLNDYSHMPTPRHSMGAALLGGKIYTVGGIPGDTWSTNAVNTVEVFDPATETWAPPDPNVDMNIARFLHSVVEVGGKVYAIGGYGTLRAVGVFTP